MAVDSNGDAWVANLNTVGSTLGSVVKILNSGSGCSTDNTVASWSGATSPDGCVVQYTTLDVNTVTISALAIDGADNLWVRPAPCTARPDESLQIIVCTPSGVTICLMPGRIVCEVTCVRLRYPKQCIAE